MTQPSKSAQSHIFEKAVELFAEYGYDNVSMYNIAAAIGTRIAEIYNAYESKESILNHIYNYYEATYACGRLTPDQYLPILKKGTAMDILNVVNYPLQEPVVLNFNVIRIIWSRSYTDSRAKQLYQKCVIEDGIQYLTTLLTLGKQLNRIVMTDQEIDSFTTAYLGLRVFAASKAVVEPNQPKWRALEIRTTEYLSQLIHLNPPV